jgi:hypothetical protein
MATPPAPNETLTLKPSPTKWLLLAVTFLALAVGMAALYAYSESPKDGESLIVVGSLVVFFAAGAVLSIMNLLPGRAYLLLASGEFAYRTLFKSRSYRWSEVEQFSSFAFRQSSMVVFTLSQEGKLRFSENGFRKFNKAISGGDDSLPDTYGMSADKLAELMNQRKEKSIH